MLVVVGLLRPWPGSLPLSRLPDDIVIERENSRFYLPITTMVIAGAVPSPLFCLFSN